MINHSTLHGKPYNPHGAGDGKPKQGRRLTMSQGTVPVMFPIPNFAIWKTVTLGGYKKYWDFEEALERAGFRISELAGFLLARTWLANKISRTVDLVKVTVGELGFSNEATTTEIYARARELGLSLCPAEVGPALRLAYSHQPADEWIYIAMEPIVDFYSGDIDSDVFCVAHVGRGQWLRAPNVRAADCWDTGYVWVFVRSPASSGASR